MSSFGSDEDLVATVRKYEPHLKRTRSFSEGDTSSEPDNSSASEKSNLFQYVKKTGANIRARLVNTKELALGPKFGRTQPCHKTRCMCCPMILDNDVITVNGRRVRSAPGNCKTYNVIYLVQCSLCDKIYIGRTVNKLHIRLDGHRSKFYEIANGNTVDVTKDEYCLGLHLADHGLTDHGDFNETFKVFIVENCSPKLLEYKENKYIHLLKTLRPLGLNTKNPFGITMHF